MAEEQPDKEFEVLEEVYTHKPSEGSGDGFKSVALIKGEKPDEEWKYIEFRKGEAPLREDMEGEQVRVKEIQERMTFGNAEYIDNVRDSLDEIIDEI